MQDSLSGHAAGADPTAVERDELFPTSYRSTSSGARMILGTLGGVLGLYVESILFGIFGSHWTAISIMVVFALAGPLIVLAFFPETSGRTLEEISPEV